MQKTTAVLSGPSRSPCPSPRSKKRSCHLPKKRCCPGLCTAAPTAAQPETKLYGCGLPSDRWTKQKQDAQTDTPTHEHAHTQQDTPTHGHTHTHNFGPRSHHCSEHTWVVYRVVGALCLVCLCVRVSASPFIATFPLSVLLKNFMSGSALQVRPLHVV